LKLLKLAYLLAQSFSAEFGQSLDRMGLRRLWPGVDTRKVLIRQALQVKYRFQRT
jgi:hypothetical protein